MKARQLEAIRIVAMFAATLTAFAWLVLPLPLALSAEGFWHQVLQACAISLTVYAIGFAMAFIVARSTEDTADPAPEPRCHQVLPYALPSLLIYFFFHLAFWPAQMSPDSLDQWDQIHTGQWGDTHAVTATILNWLVLQVYPHPASVVFAAYAAFALLTGALLCEARRWKVASPIIWTAAILFPLFLPNALLATSMWKDIPYATATLGLTYYCLKAVRTNVRLRDRDWLLFAVCCWLVLALRHNGMLISILLPLLFLFCSKSRSVRIRVALLTASNVVAVLITKLGLVWLLGANPQSISGQTFVFNPLIGAMIREGVQLEEQELALVKSIAPLEHWSSTPCDNGGAFFYSKAVNHMRIEEKATELVGLALSLAMRHPIIAFKQKACITALVWRVWNKPHEWSAFTQLGIAKIDLASKYGLTTQSLRPELRSAAIAAHNRFLAWSNPLNRPAGYMWLAVYLAIVVSILHNRNFWLVAAPFGLNALSLMIIVGTQEYRYMWPTVAASMLLMVFTFSRRYTEPVA